MKNSLLAAVLISLANPVLAATEKEVALKPLNEQQKVEFVGTLLAFGRLEVVLDEKADATQVPDEFAIEMIKRVQAGCEYSHSESQPAEDTIKTGYMIGGDTCPIDYLSEQTAKEVMESNRMVQTATLKSKYVVRDDKFVDYNDVLELEQSGESKLEIMTPDGIVFKLNNDMKVAGEMQSFMYGKIPYTTSNTARLHVRKDRTTGQEITTGTVVNKIAFNIKDYVGELQIHVTFLPTGRQEQKLVLNGVPVESGGLLWNAIPARWKKYVK